MREEHSDIDLTLAAAVKGRDFDAAETALKHFLLTQPNDAHRWHQLGHCRSELGNLRGAAEALENACRLGPDVAARWIDLGAVRARLSDLEAAERALGVALTVDPNNPIAQGNHAQVLVRQGRLEAGVAQLRKTWSAYPHLGWVAEALALALDENGQGDAALVVLEQANAATGGQLALQLGRQALKQGRIPQAQALAEQLRQSRPWHAGAIDLAYQAGRAHGSKVEPRNLSQLIGGSRPDNLQGRICEDLAAHVCAHPSLLPSPHGHATVHGWHTGSLRVNPRGPVAQLETTVEQALAAYVRTPPPDSVWRPSGALQVMFNIWGVVFRGQAGHQHPHIHPDAWLSGVFYAQLPPDMQTPDARQQQLGWLRFTDGPQRGEAPLHAHEPMVGQLLLFPAYLYHHTVPCPFASARVSVAFDVVPLG